MPEVLEGQLTRHQNQPFYAQKQRPQLFWGGCLVPILVITIIGFFIIQGLTSAANSGALRVFVLAVLLFSFGQLIFGGTIFARTRSSLGKGLLLGAGLLLLLLIIAIIGVASALTSFIG